MLAATGEVKKARVSRITAGSREWRYAQNGGRKTSSIPVFRAVKARETARRPDDTETRSEIRGWSPRRSIIQDYVASRRVCSPDDARKHKRAGKCDGEEEERWERERWEAEERERRYGANRYLFSLTKYFSLRARYAESLSRIPAELYTYAKSDQSER